MVSSSAINTSTASSTLVSSSTGLPTWTAAMTNGQVVLGSTGATPVAATITAGTNITLTPGAGTLTIAASGAAAGGWFLIQSQTASTSATLDFTTGITSTYKTVVAVVDYAVPATDNVTLNCQLSTDGVTWFSGSEYEWAQVGRDSGSNVLAQSATGQGAAQLAANTALSIDNESNGGWCGLVWLYDLSNTVNTKMITWDGIYRVNGSTSNIMKTTGASKCETTSAITGIRFLMSSGTISTGMITLYGLKNA